MAVPRSDKPKKESVDWTAEEEAELVAVLLQAREGGTQAESGWKATTWSLVVTALATKFSPAVAKKIGPCKTCWQRLKTHYKIVKTLREQPGFGWNEGKKLVTASKEVWDVYILVSTCAAYLFGVSGASPTCPVSIGNVPAPLLSSKWCGGSGAEEKFCVT